MKKTLILCLSLVICLCSIGGYADDDLVWFTPSVANEINYSASEWYSDSANHSLLTTLLCLEIASHGVANDEGILEMLFQPSYVGKNNNDLYVIGSNSKNIIFIGYTPTQKKASYQLIDNSDYSDSVDDLIIDVMSDMCSDSYSKNNVEEIITTLAQVNTAIEQREPDNTLIVDSKAPFLAIDYNALADGMQNGSEITSMIPFGDQLGFYTVVNTNDNSIAQIFFLIAKPEVTVAFLIDGETTFEMELHNIDGQNSYHTVFSDEEQLVQALADAKEIVVRIDVNGTASDYKLSRKELSKVNSVFNYLGSHNYIDAVSSDYVETCTACSQVYPMKVN